MLIKDAIGRFLKQIVMQSKPLFAVFLVWPENIQKSGLGDKLSKMWEKHWNKQMVEYKNKHINKFL